MDINWDGGYKSLQGEISKLSIHQKKMLMGQTHLNDFGEPILDSPWFGPHRYSIYLWLLSRQTTVNEITRLDLRGCELPFLPPEISSFSNLQTLLLCSNSLSILPQTLGELPLQNLSLGCNSISKIPKSLQKCGMTLEYLTLGHNNIKGEYSFLREEFYFLKRGSIGNSQIPEPIGNSWMMYADAREATIRMHEWLEACFLLEDQVWLNQAIEILKQCDEPMIDEILYKDCHIKDSIFYTPYHQESLKWLRFVLRVRLTKINEGAVVHPSLWNKNLDPLWEIQIPTSEEWKEHESMSIR